jgi:hypothetical protein
LSYFQFGGLALAVPFGNLCAGVRRLQFGRLTLALSRRILGAYSLILGFAFGDERSILGGDLILRDCVNPIPGDLQLAAD